MLRNDEVNIKRMLLMAEFEPMPREITEKIELAERLLANRSQERTYAFRELSLVLALMDALTIVENARQVRIGEVEAVLKDKRYEDVIRMARLFPADYTPMMELREKAVAARIKLEHGSERRGQSAQTPHAG